MAITKGATINRAALLDRVEQSNGSGRRQPKPKVQIHRSTGGSRGGRRLSADGDKHTVDQVMQFEIYTPDHPDVRAGKRAPDDMLVVLLKGEINSAGICRRDLYAFVGTGPSMLFENENQAYNLEYGLRKRATITMDSVHKWMSIIGKEFMMITQTVDAGWFNAVLDIRDRLLSDEGVTVEELRELAERSVEE